MDKIKQIPSTENPIIIRTDFSNQEIWQSICVIIQEPSKEGFLAYVEFLDDMQYAGITKDQILELVSKSYDHAFIMVVDHTTISHSEFPLLILDLNEERGHEFRAIPSTIQSIENNLSVANMGFEDFAYHVDKDGVFRGF